MLFLLCATVRELRAFRLLSGDNIGAGLGKLCWFGGSCVQIFHKGTHGPIRPSTGPRNHAVSYQWCESGIRLCIRFGHLGCRGGVPSAAEGL